MPPHGPRFAEPHDHGIIVDAHDGHHGVSIELTMLISNPDQARPLGDQHGQVHDRQRHDHPAEAETTG